VIPIHYVDANQDKKTKVLVETKKPSGYEPTPEYHPTMKAVKCSGCGGVGIVEFVNGFDLKKGDALMEGKNITGVCHGKCGGRAVEFIPISRFLAPHEEKEIQHLYKIAAALDYASKQNYRVGDNSLILPVGKLKEYEKRINAAKADLARTAG
jgi:hypothetical protein